MEYVTNVEVSKFFAAFRRKTDRSGVARPKAVARQNFSCCGGCASYELATTLPSRTIVAFTHAQDQGSFKDGELVEPLFIKFGATFKSSEGEECDRGLELEAAFRLCEAAEEVGLSYEWEGDIDKCFILLPGTKTKPVRRWDDPVYRKGSEFRRWKSRMDDFIRFDLRRAYVAANPEEVPTGR